MATFRTSRLFDGIFIICLLILLSWVWFNRLAVSDWLFFKSYHASSRIMLLADQAGLNPTGQKLLYRTDPQFVSQSVILKNCGELDDLGCLSSKGQAFILDSTENTGDSTVTAVHEMLHLAYRRLSPAQQAELAPLIDEAITQNNEAGIAKQLDGITLAADRRDEAHSILATEYTTLPDELELYYKTYFTNRLKLVAIADANR